MAHPSAVAPFAPPPRFYEDFEPHSNTEFKCPAPPPPLEGPYVMFGKQYDTSFSPQDPSIAHRQFGLDLEFENQSPVATLRLLNRLLPDEYLKLMQMMIERPVLLRDESDQKKITDLDQQRERVENIIAAMHLTLSRFRPYQARQALITALRDQVERRQKEAKELRECREKAQGLIKGASMQLKAAKDALASAQAAEMNAEHALSAAGDAAAGKPAAGVGMLSLQPQAVGAPPAPSSNTAAAPAPTAAEAAHAAGKGDAKPQASAEEASAVATSSRGEEVAPEKVRKRRRTAEIISRLDGIPRDIQAPPKPALAPAAK